MLNKIFVFLSFCVTLSSAQFIKYAPVPPSGYSYARVEYLYDYINNSLYGENDASYPYQPIDGTQSFYKYEWLEINQNNDEVWIRSKFDLVPLDIPLTMNCQDALGVPTCYYLPEYGNGADSSCESDGNYNVEMSGTIAIDEDDYYACYSKNNPNADDNTTDNNNTDNNATNPNIDNNNSLTDFTYGIGSKYELLGFDIRDELLASINNNIVASSNKIGTSNNELSSINGTLSTKLDTSNNKLSDIHDELSTLNDLMNNNQSTDNTDQLNILNQINSNISENNTNMNTVLSGISSDITTSLSSSSEQNHNDLSSVSTKIEKSNQELSELNTKMQSMNDFMQSSINNTEASDSFNNAQNQATSTVSSITGSLSSIISSYTGTAPIVTGTGNHIFTDNVFGKTITFDLSMFETLKPYFDILWLLMLAYFNFKMYVLIIRDLLKKF